MKNKLFTDDRFVQLVIGFADDAKGEAITWIDVQNDNFPVRKIVLITALNTVHLRAMSESIQTQSKEKIRDAGDKADMIEPTVSGVADSGWIILDFGSVAVHVLTRELRDYYELDRFFEKQGVMYHYE